MASPSTKDLVDELVERVRLASASFGDRLYTVYNLEDIGTVNENAGYPLAAVGYEGATPAAGNAAAGAEGRTTFGGDTLLVVRRFSVIVAVEYNWNNEFEDQKQVATDLLDAIRPKLLGFKGVNDRPWRFVGEGPTSESIDGVIFYAQIWETMSVEKGSTV
jgi:hypothetical protein